MPKTVTRRDGSQAAFDLRQVSQALAAAGRATGEFGEAETTSLAQTLAARLPSSGLVALEDIQDLAERVLMEAGYFDTARAYIIHRERHARIRRDKKAVVDVAASMNEYLSREDWRVHANANQGYSLGGLILN